jgi:hypothetical protein
VAVLGGLQCQSQYGTDFLRPGFGFLALGHGQLLFQSRFLLLVGLAMLGGFVVLRKVYFFSVPLIGVSISLACYVASIALSGALLMRS